MAEFTEVIRHYNRMVERWEKSRIIGKSDIEHGKMKLDNLLGESAAAFEKFIMQWAKDNPELQYPSWVEWRDKNFPSADAKICPACFMSETEAQCNLDCQECINKPIPEAVAKKLHISPVEVRK